MPRVPITMPQLGESIAEATITRFLRQPGQDVELDQDVLEVETNKATMNVSSPCPGLLAEWAVEEGESCPVGSVLGYVEATIEQMEKVGLNGHGTARPETTAPAAPGKPAVSPLKPVVEPTVRGLPVPAHAAGIGYMSPRMKARMQELGLHAADLAGIPGSGAAGRVTVEDFERFVAQLEKNKLTQASPMRVAVADAMRRSWTRPLATVGLAAGMDALLAHRASSNPKPGPALYALRALAIALSENRAPAGRLIGNKIVHPPAIDIGFAVEAEDGVLVPVLRHVEKRRLAELIRPYNELVELARQRRLPREATGGSIATVTNFGTFGLIWATPIPLPEQTLVLGLGAGRRVPAWDNDKQQFLPAVESELTLSFDHRVLDGGAAGRLLNRVVYLMGHPQEL